MSNAHWGRLVYFASCIQQVKVQVTALKQNLPFKKLLAFYPLPARHSTFANIVLPSCMPIGCDTTEESLPGQHLMQLVWLKKLLKPSSVWAQVFLCFFSLLKSRNTFPPMHWTVKLEQLTGNMNQVTTKQRRHPERYSTTINNKIIVTEISLSKEGEFFSPQEFKIKRSVFLVYCIIYTKLYGNYTFS